MLPYAFMDPLQVWGVPYTWIPPNPNKEVWTGPMPTYDDMRAQFDAIKPVSCYAQDLEREDVKFTEQDDVLIEVMDRQRLVKSTEEIEQLKRGCQASAEAFREIMTTWNTMREQGELQSESALDGWFTYQFKKRGANDLAYVNVVASGKNATILHYERNECPIQDGNLVLVDAGGEYGYYASDITRTWPARGDFTEEQREVYHIVREVQRKCIAMVRPGMTMGTIHEYAQALITKGVIDLGLPGNYNYFPHSIGHWMGLDVHDCMCLHWKKHDIPLQSGMVVTIEPGIYIPDQKDMGKYRGIGVRLEDDILVTDTGYFNMTSAAPFWEDLQADTANPVSHPSSSA